MNDPTRPAIHRTVLIAGITVLLSFATAAIGFAQSTTPSAPTIQPGSIRMQQPKAVSLASKASTNLVQAINAATASHPGATPLKAVITIRQGWLVYEVQITDPTSPNGLTTVVVDAGNSRILGSFPGNLDQGQAVDQQGEHQDQAGQSDQSDSSNDKDNENAGSEN